MPADPVGPTAGRAGRSAPTGRTGAGRVRPRLDASTILEAALRLAVTDTAEPLTVRRLGTELGADPTAIYRHFRDKDELVRAAIDRLIADCVARVDPDAPWRSRLTQLADASLDLLCAHPTLGAAAASQTTGGDGELAAVELIIEAMAEAGLDQDAVVRFYAVFSSYLLAFCSAQAGTVLAAGSPEDAADQRWVGGSPALHRSRYPAIAAVRDQLESLEDPEVYRAGVQVLLDAVAAQASST